jgi:hypothetical protein
MNVYDQPSSWMSVLDNQEARAAAKKLDLKLIALEVHVTAEQA